jgi:hypothetical protein
MESAGSICGTVYLSIINTYIMKYNFDFALTTHCQARCRSCARTDENTGGKEDWLKLTHMDIEIFNKRLTSFSKDIGYIQFCGELGDPMMHPRIREFIDTALLYTDRVNINTNGGLRNPNWYKNLAKDYGHPSSKYPSKRVYIKFGIDGTDHDTNWLYREGVDWQRAMDNMKFWFSEGGNGSWHFIIFDWNWHQIPEAAKLAKDIGCEVEFKFNNRNHGLITDENKKIALMLLEDIYEV